MIFIMTYRSFLFMMASAIYASNLHAEMVSQNLTVAYNKVQVVDNYSAQSKSGLIRVNTCGKCPALELILDQYSLLILDGRPIAMESLLSIRFKYPSSMVRIQYNDRDKTLSYIRWTPNDAQVKGLI